MKHKIVAMGEVLWDLLPSGPELGGAPTNFAAHCRSLGAEVWMVTRVGDDALGLAVLDRFRGLNLPTETVQVDPSRPTGTVEVAFDPAGQPRYSILEGVAWDAIEADLRAMTHAREADAVCFGSLAQRSEGSRRSIRALVDAAKPGAFRVFDVNLRAPFVDRDVIAESLGLANILKLNDEELPELATMFGLSATEVRPAILGLARGFGLSMVALTRGASGSLLMADGVWSDHPGCPSGVMADPIGAGDAFTAALVVGLLAGRPLQEINRHANNVAAFVCTRSGGTPTLPDSLRFPPPTRSASVLPSYPLPMEFQS